MKISIFVPDLSCTYGNCMSRAYIFAKILQRKYEVEIFGPALKDYIWDAVAGDKATNFVPVDFQNLSLRQFNRLRQQLQELVRQADGDLIYISKPLLIGLGVGFAAQRSRQVPVLLDIDDWQMGFRQAAYAQMSVRERWKDLRRSAAGFYKTTSYWNNLFGEWLATRADAITVSNRFLQSKFGGTLLRTAEDTDTFDPNKYDRDRIRSSLNISSDRKIVMFCGTPRVHKGVEELVDAVALIDDPSLLLVIVGNDNGQYANKFVDKSTEKLGDRFLAFGLQPYEKVPEFLSIADAVVIPQRQSQATLGQVPIKVYDAMAMAKPIVASRVSDLPEILDGCAWLVEPQHPQDIADALNSIFQDSQQALKMGEAARTKCVDRYSWDAIGSILDRTIEAAFATRPNIPTN